MKPTREFTANVGDASTGVAGPDYIEKDLDKALKMFDPLALLPDGVNYGGIAGENIKQVATAAALPTTGLSNPDIRLVQNPAGDGSVPPDIYIWDGVTWRSYSPSTDYAVKFNATTGHKHTGVTGDAPKLPNFDATTGHKHTGAVGDAPQITTTGIADGAITTAKIGDLNVDATKIANGAVITAKIADGNVTGIKLTPTLTGSTISSGVLSTVTHNLGRIPLIMHWVNTASIEVQLSWVTTTQFSFYCATPNTTIYYYVW